MVKGEAREPRGVTVVSPPSFSSVAVQLLALLLFILFLVLREVALACWNRMYDCSPKVSRVFCWLFHAAITSARRSLQRSVNALRGLREKEKKRQLFFSSLETGWGLEMSEKVQVSSDTCSDKCGLNGEHFFPMFFLPAALKCLG